MSIPGQPQKFYRVAKGGSGPLLLPECITGVYHQTEFSTDILPDRTNLEFRHSICCPRV